MADGYCPRLARRSDEETHHGAKEITEARLDSGAC
jgi:hypothetical protein